MVRSQSHRGDSRLVGGNTSPAMTSHCRPLPLISALVMLAVTGCTDAERVSAQDRSSTVDTVAEEPHSRFDVLFARDVIEHGAQAIALSDLLVDKDGVALPVVDVARLITADNGARTTELQALLVDWGFTPMTVRPEPPAAGPAVAVQPGEHPLATDADFRVVRESTGPRATNVFLDLMIRQNGYTISAARAELQDGSHPGAMAIAQSLIDQQQAETSAMAALKR